MPNNSYEEGMKAIFYTETNEIEIVKDDTPRCYFYFENKYQLADLINSSPRLAKELKELLK